MFQPVGRRPNVQGRYYQSRSRDQGRAALQGGKLDKFSTSLDTVQQVLGVVRSTAPYIEKYGPIVQRIPTMYRIYRAMQAVDVEEEPEQREMSASKKKNESIKKEQPSHEYPMPTLYI